MGANLYSEAYTAPAPPLHVPLMDGLFSPAMTAEAEPTWQSIGFEGDPFDDGEEIEAESESAAPIPQGVTLRPYQSLAVKNVVETHQSGVTGALCVSATGTGKSLMIAKVAKHYEPEGVLILVHREELIGQIRNSCAMVGVATGLEKASSRGLDSFKLTNNVVVASVQSMQGNRLLQWPADSFGCIQIDEAHHAISRTYANIYERFGWTREAPQNGPKLVGWTATPKRADKKNIGALFGAMAFEYSLKNAVKDGWLVKPKVNRLETDPPIDLRGLRTTKQGDFSAEDLEELIIANLNPLANAVAQCEQVQGRRAIAFFPDIESARLGAAAFEKVGLSANWVSGVCRDRAEKLAGHKKGEFQILCNSMLCAEGYDDPQIGAVILCRPTKSVGLLAQMVGRGTRLHPASGKSDCWIIDFDWQIDEKTLATPVELFNDGSIPDEVLQIAKELEDEDGGGDLEEILETAERVHAERVRDRIRRQKIPMRGKLFDPLGIAEFFDIPVHKSGYEWAEVRKATDKQRAALEKFGSAAPPEMPFALAKAMLDKLISRSQHGWVSMRDANALIDAGFDADVARGMRQAEAKSQLHEINSQIPATKGQVWMLQSKYGIEAPIGCTKADATILLSEQKRLQG